MKRVVYWDSDAFLRVINQDGTPEEQLGCGDVWAACIKGTTHIVTSTLTIAEVIHKKGVVKLDPANRPLINNFFRQNFISLKPLTREIAELARDIVWDSNIMPKDAVHVATCGFFKYREMHSFDKNLVGKKDIPVRGFSIRVGHPKDQVQAELIREQELTGDEEDE